VSSITASGMLTRACSPLSTPLTGPGLAPLLDINNRDPLAAGTLAPRLLTGRVNKPQLLLVLVDVNNFETSNPPPPHPAARRHLRGPGRKALAALVLSGVALVIFGRLTLSTLLVIAAVGAIVAAARRNRPKK
jgi:hypothetical protein